MTNTEKFIITNCIFEYNLEDHKNKTTVAVIIELLQSSYKDTSNELINFFLYVYEQNDFNDLNLLKLKKDLKTTLQNYNLEQNIEILSFIVLNTLQKSNKEFCKIFSIVIEMINIKDFNYFLKKLLEKFYQYDLLKLITKFLLNIKTDFTNIFNNILSSKDVIKLFLFYPCFSLKAQSSKNLIVKQAMFLNEKDKFSLEIQTDLLMSLINNNINNLYEIYYKEKQKNQAIKNNSKFIFYKLTNLFIEHKKISKKNIKNYFHLELKYLIKKISKKL